MATTSAGEVLPVQPGAADDRTAPWTAWAATVTAAATSLALGLVTLRSSTASGPARALAVLGIAAGPLTCFAAWRLRHRLRVFGRQARESSRRLDLAAVTGHELVWEIEPNGVVTYMSEVAREMFGVDPADMVGQSVFILLPPEQQDAARALLADSVREGRGWTGLRFAAAHADGELRWVETTGVAHVDDAGRVYGFTATTRHMDTEAVRRMAQEIVRDRIQRVLAERRLTTVFQPIVDLESGQALGHEALSRFPDEPAQGPDRWFAEAEQVGLGVELDLLAVEIALVAAEQLPARGYVSINVTPAALQSPSLQELLGAAALPGERLVVEITEHVSVEDYQTLRQPLEALRAMGVRLAVDDAGAGYASFRHILRLRPEFIKLDQEITRDIQLDPARRALAAAVVMFALDVGATVIAEGVETDDELAMVANLGIDAAQGYLLGRPSADPTQWMRSWQFEHAAQSSAGRHGL